MDDHAAQATVPMEIMFAAELFAQLPAAEQDALIARIESLLSEQ